jgi:hypothetical protein
MGIAWLRTAIALRAARGGSIFCVERAGANERGVLPCTSSGGARACHVIAPGTMSISLLAADRVSVPT